MTEIEKNVEREILRKVKSGDINAFEEIVKSYEKKICQTIYFMLKDESIVEDVAQEVFIKIYKNLNKFNEQSSLYTWIYRITMNACYDEIKREQKIKMFSTHIEMDDHDEEIEIVDESQNVENIVEDKFERQQLVDAIKRLPAEARALIVLRDIRGFSYWEISDMLKMKLGTVKSKISRARLALRNELLKDGYNYKLDDEK